MSHAKPPGPLFPRSGPLFVSASRSIRTIVWPKIANIPEFTIRPSTAEVRETFLSLSLIVAIINGPEKPGRSTGKSASSFSPIPSLWRQHNNSSLLVTPKSFLAPRRIVWESFEQWLSSDILRDRLQRGPLPLGTPLSEGFDALCAERYQGEPRCNRCPRISSGNHLGSFSTRFSEEPPFFSTWARLCFPHHDRFTRRR